MQGPRLSFETMGNATLVVREDGRPVLATDPWLVGTAYFGSWALDHDLTPEQIASVAAAGHIWISHGHPDHLHPESLSLLPRTQPLLVPDHYHPEMREYLESLGFSVRVLRFKAWTPLTGAVRVMCLENENQDAVLLIEAGDALLVNANDSQTYGHERCLARLIACYPKTYLLSLCAIDADMINVVDAQGRMVTPAPNAWKPGTIVAVADRCTRLGVQRFCCFSSQHVYVRADSAWANPYRITWAEMRTYWNSPTCELIEPFVTVDLADGRVQRNHPGQPESDRVPHGTGADDWGERMTAADWADVEAFITKFVTLRRHLDFLAFVVAGEQRTIRLRPAGRRRERGIRFFAPRRSLVDAARGGYFDDLLIGNFARTQLVDTSLYPHFTPLVAKFGGAAKVYTPRELWACRAHYFRLAPAAYTLDRIERWWVHRARPRVRALMARLGCLDLAKRLSRRLRRLPPIPAA
jgi:hypothetical protein